MAENHHLRKELIMDSRIKLLCIVFALSLLALPLTGCDNPPWESGSVLVLNIDTPQDGATVTTPKVTVSGRVVGTESKEAKVTINSADVPVAEGKFSTDVILTEGKNVIAIAGTSGQGKPSKTVTVTYVPAKQ
jgi:hypothetical protein